MSNDTPLTLVAMGEAAGGRVDPDRILARPAGSPSRTAFLRAQELGWLDGQGYVTNKGRQAIEDDDG